MINSNQLQNLKVIDFSIMYSECYISSLVENIVCGVLETAFANKDKIFTFDLSKIHSSYYELLVEKLKTRFKVSSIYTAHTTLFIDWSL